jgi:hypothetical protein
MVMTEIELLKLRFPIGNFLAPIIYSPEIRKEGINTIENFPARLSQEFEGLNPDYIKASYRPNGWNIAQIVHHLADSHLNAFCRFKLALTEDTPSVKPYFEERWAQLSDGKNSNISASIQIITGLHARWTFLLKTLDDADLQKGFFHPEYNEIVTLNETLARYAWHSEHHLAHIRLAKQNPY